MLSVSPAIRDTSGKLKQSNIASSQYVTQLIVYACVYVNSERKRVSNGEIFFSVFPLEYQIKLFLRQARGWDDTNFVFTSS